MPDTIKTVSVPITGMHCAQCALTIEKKLSSLPGITNAAVNFSNSIASITFKSSKLSIEHIEKEIRSCGFDTALSSLTIILDREPNKTESQKIITAFDSIDTIVGVVFNNATIKLTINTYNNAPFIRELKNILSDTGLPILRIISDDTIRTAEKDLLQTGQKMRLIRFLTAFSVSLPLMASMLFGHHFISTTITAILAFPVFVFVSIPIYRSAYRAILVKSLTMDVMYALGITTAFSASLATTFGISGTTHFMLYDTAIMLAGFLTLGRYLETRARVKTGDSIKKLLQLQPATATIEDHGILREIPVEEVTAGQIVFIRPGDRIPVDGDIISGSGSIDESMITGESFPVFKETGANVIGGTINKTGVLRFIAKRVGSETMLSSIIRMVRNAQNSRPPLQKIADTAVAWFIPIVFVIALLSFFVWYFIIGSTFQFALTTLISVLVVACPCALGLASPTAVTVGIGRGAELGILIKNGDALERIHSITKVLFDKTGTLTEGKLSVASVMPTKTYKGNLLLIAASVEMCSSHPVASAIVNEARNQSLLIKECSNAIFVNGKGVYGNIDGRHVVAGNRTMMHDFSIDITEIELLAGEYERHGKTVIFIADNGNPAGCIAISDTIKPSARKTVERLKQRGISCGIISGDMRSNVEAVGIQTGITDSRAEVLPNDKAAIIQEIRTSGEKVAFVGDGINDAPALACADVGIALGGGTAIALESADVILVGGDLVDVVTALQLGKKVYSRIKGNLFWAFAYNSALIPLATGVLYPLFSFVFKPELAGLAMALSSVTVVTRSLMLRRFTPEKK